MSKNNNNNQNQDITHVSDMYKDWFLEYASYVILDRAVPTLEDGLKPVQRRLLHALKEMDDGRYHKVANAIGQTMQFHPHGDASIYEALVNLGQKDLLIDTQGNWGDVRTGDSAAASRYIEARLSKFALEVAFNPDITEWQLSYDGRKKEPVNLPLKFPLLLAQGVEGIAVGLSTRILPHNFQELCKASVAVLRGKEFTLYPDFLTGGMADCNDYRDGQRGGRIRVRAKIDTVDKKMLVIREIPYGTTTSGLIDSILKANDKGKIKIKKVVDNTAKDIEIVIELPAGVSPDVTIDALYAFTDCEMPISPSCCLIIDKKPRFIGVSELLKLSTAHTLALLKAELEFRLKVLLEKLFFSSLEKIFIEKRIYRKIEECETFDAVIDTIDKGLKPYTKNFLREVTRDDILRLTEIKIKRISKYDSFKADEAIKALEEEIAEIKHNLAHLTDYAVNYFNDLLKKYGKGRERKTEIRNFDTIAVAQVAQANQKLYVNRKDGFMGYGLKKDEYVCDCSDIDDIIVFRADGKFQVSKVAEKTFVGKDIVHIDVWRKNDERRIYHAIYLDAEAGKNYVKRFAVTAITRDKEYDITSGAGKGSKLVYLSVHPNSEAETVVVSLHTSSKAKIKEFEYDFGDLAIKGRDAKGNVLTPYPIRKVVQKQVGASTQGGRKVWLDDSIGRLNTEGRGKLLGEFDTGDRILVVHKDGSYELTDYELTNRFDAANDEIIEKFNPETIISAIYYHPEKKGYYVKRFQIETGKTGQKFYFTGEDKKYELLFVSTEPNPVVTYHYITDKTKVKGHQTLAIEEAVNVQGRRTLGNKLTGYKITKIERVAGAEGLTVQLIKQVVETAKAETKTAAPIKQSIKTAKKDQGELF
ncbi:DNA gyrase/topoisomerase IV subunit A [Sphingobacteriales bacterium UPWRP_1]|nr:DNA topoisomerase IV [Sphingobacteriales bacterium TSM_CSS]PSJ72125.1 DNA gyrase/topoisomerase IV subunit A [Sphingobacteriales bacterium UPWRP_1]